MRWLRRSSLICVSNNVCVLPRSVCVYVATDLCVDFATCWLVRSADTYLCALTFKVFWHWLMCEIESVRPHDLCACTLRVYIYSVFSTWHSPEAYARNANCERAQYIRKQSTYLYPHKPFLCKRILHIHTNVRDAKPPKTSRNPQKSPLHIRIKAVRFWNTTIQGLVAMSLVVGSLKSRHKRDLHTRKRSVDCNSRCIRASLQRLLL